MGRRIPDNSKLQAVIENNTIPGTKLPVTSAIAPTAGGPRKPAIPPRPSKTAKTVAALDGLLECRSITIVKSTGR